MRKENPKENYFDLGNSTCGVFTPRLEQDKGKILLSFVLEEYSKIYTLSVVIV